MGVTRKNLIGYKFGRLTVVKELPSVHYSRIKYHRYFLCRCECGKEKRIGYHNFTHVVSCGCECKRREWYKHRKIDPRLVMRRTWNSMMNRCYSKNNIAYKHYGGRGIKIVKKWHIFENFYKDMGDRPGKHLSIDRINTNGNYSKGNCRWATRSQQMSNRRNSKKYKVPLSATNRK